MPTQTYLTGIRASGRTTVATASAVGLALAGNSVVYVAANFKTAKRVFDEMYSTIPRDSIYRVVPSNGKIEGKGFLVDVFPVETVLAGVRGRSVDVIIMDCEITPDSLSAASLSAGHLLLVPMG